MFNFELRFPGNVLLRVEDSLDNLKFGKTQAYFLGSNNFTRSESGSFLQERFGIYSYFSLG